MIYWHIIVSQLFLPSHFNTIKMKKGPVEEKRQAWVGDISDEKGGASLKFEPLLDDTSFIDSRWTRRLVVRAMEMLYYEQQWERLADVAMKFNMLTK